MATTMLRIIRRRCACRAFAFIQRNAVESRRNILSEAYTCDHKWKQRLESPVLKQVKFSQFAVQLLEKFDRDGSAGVIDMSIFANKLQDMHETEQPMVENILQNFRHSPQAIPVPDAINHAIVKAFIETNRTDLLLQYIKDKNKFGIFPENHAFSILMDFFINHEDYRGAAQVAYEIMLQEDLSHPVSYLLSLYACIKHLKHPIDEPKQEEQAPAEEENKFVHVTMTRMQNLTAQKPIMDLQSGFSLFVPLTFMLEKKEEEQWIPVNVIRCPYYDDHFDIKDDNFLLGKTLYMLGKESYLSGEKLGRSLQVIGLGLYQKYAKALDLLEKWVSSDMQAVIYDEALERFKSCLENAQTRDAEEPEKEMGIRTIDDEIHKMKPTPAQKSECLQRLQSISEKIMGRTVTGDIENLVSSFVQKEVPKYEQSDIQNLTALYDKWDAERRVLLESQMKEYLRKQKESEIVSKLKELQEKEELLTYFERKHEIVKLKKKADKQKKKKEEKEEEEFVEAPALRTKGKKA